MDSQHFLLVFFSLQSVVDDGVLGEIRQVWIKSDDFFLIKAAFNMVDTYYVMQGNDFVWMKNKTQVGPSKSHHYAILEENRQLASVEIHTKIVSYYTHLGFP